MANRTKCTTEKRAKLLEAIALCGGNVTRACESVALARRTVYDWRDRDPEFAEQFEQAIQRGAEVLEDECRRRAFEGVEEPLHHKGELTGAVVRKYSDVLAIFLLKGAMPHKYRERISQEVSGPGGGPIQSNVVVYLPDNGRDGNGNGNGNGDKA